MWNDLVHIWSYNIFFRNDYFFHEDSFSTSSLQVDVVLESNGKINKK